MVIPGVPAAVMFSWLAIFGVLLLQSVSSQNGRKCALTLGENRPARPQSHRANAVKKKKCYPHFCAEAFEMSHYETLVLLKIVVLHQKIR